MNLFILLRVYQEHNTHYKHFFLILSGIFFGISTNRPCNPLLHPFTTIGLRLIFNSIRK